MVRTTYTALSALVVAAFLFIGCGGEDLTPVTTEWAKAGQDLDAKLKEVKDMHTDVMGAFTNMPVADTMDSSMVAMHTQVGETLKDQENTVGMVSELINAQKSNLDSLAGQSLADANAKWEAAKIDYADANAKLDAIKSTLEGYKADMAKMAAGHGNMQEGMEKKEGEATGADTTAKSM